MEYKKSVIITTYSSLGLVLLLVISFFLMSGLPTVYAIAISYSLAVFNFTAGVFISAAILRSTSMLAKALIPLEFFARMALTGIIFFLVHKYFGAILSLSLILFAAFIFLLILSSMLIYLVMNKKFHRNRLAGQEK
ncbi:MAG: hypothetical protein M1371_00275 [Actinobacteria bacterium]|nr:hypothetical protein [Actinomycetota bacterium]